MSNEAELQRRADELHRTGDTEGALEACRSLLELRPDSPELLNKMGELCLALGRADGSSRFYEEALSAATPAAAPPEQPEDAQAPSAAVGRALTSWEEVRSTAEDLIERDEHSQAFRLVLSFHAAEATDESAAFLREGFREAPLRIAVAMVQGIGNMVMLTPALRALKWLYPRSELEVVGLSPALDVVRGWTLVDRVTALASFDATAERDVVLLSMWSGLFRRMHEMPLSAAGVPFVAVGFEGRDRHEAEFHLDLARLLGFDGSMPEPYCHSEEVGYPFAPGRPVALLADTSNPDAEWQRKRWPHFRELAHSLARTGYQVGLIGGRLEAEAFDPTGWPPEVVNLMGDYSIPQTTHLLECADLLVANDSGPAHMAAAVGTETHVIFGPTLDSKNLPLGPRVRTITSDFGCRPCQYLQSWVECESRRCMAKITVEHVLDSIRAPAPVEDPPEEPAPEPIGIPRDDRVMVDLGCGRFKRRSYLGIDSDPESSADIVCDVSAGIPLRNDSVDYLAAGSILSRLGDDFMTVMDEIWRVCRAGARVEINVPLCPSTAAASDPTHRRYFTAETFSHFDPSSPLWRASGEASGARPFRIVSQRALGDELEVVLAPDKTVALASAASGPGEGASRICFVSHNQPGAGGAENAMHQVANGLVACGYNVTVIYNERPFIHKVPVAEPPDTLYRIEWVKGPDLALLHEAASARLAEMAGELDVCMPLWRATSPGIIRTCQDHGVPVGIWCQNVQYAPDRSNNSIFRHADFSVVVTPYGRLVLQKRFGRTHDVFVIPNAAGDAFFDAHRERDRTEMRRFVFFGRLADSQKGLFTLCEALRQLKPHQPDFRLDVIGTGPDMDMMKARLGSWDLGENVRFMGWHRPSEVARLLGDYDLCILPSIFEGCSLAVTECMAAGLPVLTTPVGGTPWLITDKKEGLLVPPRDTEALCQAIRWAGDHLDQMNLMARWARKKALRRYHWDRVVRDYRKLFARVGTASAPCLERRQAG